MSFYSGTKPNQLPVDPTDHQMPQSEISHMLPDNRPNRDHTRMVGEHIDKLNHTHYAPNDTPQVG
jgi:hypothetical protein